MRVLVAGDTHMAGGHVRYLLQEAHNRGCEQVWQVGDFGYWPHTPKGQLFLAAVNQAAAYHDIEVYWLRGNHDNLPAMIEAHAPRIGDSVRLDTHLVYLHDGYVTEVDGLSVAVVSGAYSIDKTSRLRTEANHGMDPNTLWFEGEDVNPEAVDHVLNNTVDLLLCHEAPAGVEVLSHHMGDMLTYPQANRNRHLLAQVVRGSQVQVVIHGHHHVFYDGGMVAPHGDVRVVGLGCDGMQRRSFVVLDTEELKASLVGRMSA